MNQLMQAVLENPAVRSDQAVSVAATQAAAAFEPWATSEL